MGTYLETFLKKKKIAHVQSHAVSIKKICSGLETLRPGRREFSLGFLAACLWYWFTLFLGFIADCASQLTSVLVVSTSVSLNKCFLLLGLFWKRNKNTQWFMGFPVWTDKHDTIFKVTGRIAGYFSLRPCFLGCADNGRGAVKWHQQY